MLFQNIHPYVRYVQNLYLTKNSPILNMKAYDNRLFFITQGEGIAIINEMEYSLFPGCLILWRAGMNYSLRSKEKSLKMLGCNFDFNWAEKGNNMPIPPSKASVFNENDITEQCDFTDIIAFNNVVYLTNMDMVQPHFTNALKEYMNQHRLVALKLSAYIMMILSESAFLILGQDKISKSSHKQADEILKYIRDHYNQQLNNKMLGQHFNYHPNYINQIIVEHTGVSLHKYLLRYRVQKAIDYLQNTDYTAQHIAELIGFQDYTHFLKYFKKETGYSTRWFRH